MLNLGDVRRRKEVGMEWKVKWGLGRWGAQQKIEGDEEP